MKNLRISLVAALTPDGTIGLNGGLPWNRIPADMKRFRAITMGRPVIMGRRTYESIGKPLAGRTNIVVSDRYKFPGCICVHNFITARIIAERYSEEPVIIGGASIYKQALELDKMITMYLTIVSTDATGDTKFPSLQGKDLYITKAMKLDKGRDTDYDLQFIDCFFDNSHKKEVR